MGKKVQRIVARGYTFSYRDDKGVPCRAEAGEKVSVTPSQAAKFKDALIAPQPRAEAEPEPSKQSGKEPKSQGNK